MSRGISFLEKKDGRTYLRGTATTTDEVFKLWKHGAPIVSIAMRYGHSFGVTEVIAAVYYELGRRQRSNTTREHLAPDQR